MSRVAVLGGSVCGLYAALTLARDGHDVTVFERDPAPPADVGAVLDWDRPGTPQLRHSHAFMARAVHLLEGEHPDLYAALRDAGAAEIRVQDHLPPPLADRGPRPGDDELRAMSVRRPVFDWALHAYAARSGVVVDRTGVYGLVLSGGAVPHVGGVRLADGRTFAADVVVDASGRRTRTPRWLAEAGVSLPEESSPCGNRYYTRYYEVLPGAEPPAFQRGFVSGGELVALAVLVFRGDGRTFSLSLQTEDGDEPLRALRDPAAFTAVARLAPWAAPFLDPAVSRPLNDPAVMAGQHNLYRRLVADGTPLVTGLLLAGDAVGTSNPSFGRGVSLALVSAHLLRDALAATTDPAGQVLALDEALEREVEPFVRNAREVDARTLAGWRHALYGTPPLPRPDEVTYEDAFLAGLRDRDVWQSLMRTALLLQTPDALLADPLVRARVAENRASGWTPPVPPGPSRADVLAAVSAA
jgi:2-polyprenyl-6-methoxyphenol hydroxylase-like FAD-dependent oxidoreductase